MFRGAGGSAPVLMAGLSKSAPMGAVYSSGSERLVKLALIARLEFATEAEGRGVI
ncbi:hypothetical protein IE4803_CH03687 [Rhizobium etli bv. phaseoli str. IE4803]|nr:hypothetical protein IE4803_CH03687 [Rhizobium etli bv. phaseoli str. IE4803]